MTKIIYPSNLSDWFWCFIAFIIIMGHFAFAMVILGLVTWIVANGIMAIL